VGAGAGTIAFGWKGGIGTSSRRLPQGLGGYTVGVLVQTNFGGVLTVNGAPVGRELGRFYLQRELAPPQQGPADRGDGSIMIVVATDAPLDARNLDRLAARALSGLARTGASMTNGSGDYVIAFSTAREVRRRAGAATAAMVADLQNEGMSPLFQAVAEATEEAIYNSLFKATPVRGRGMTVDALPIDRVLDVLRRYNALNQDRTLPPGRP
jgi:D-aminopeptidase